MTSSRAAWYAHAAQDNRAWLAEALAQGVRGELPPEDAPLPLLQAYLESRLEKRIPPLLTPL